MPEVDGAQEIERARHAYDWAGDGLGYGTLITQARDEAFANLRTAILKHDPIVVALRDALETIEARQLRMIALFRQRGIVFEDIGNDPKNWQHVAFTAYSELAEVSMDARDALAEYAVGEAIGEGQG